MNAIEEAIAEDERQRAWEFRLKRAVLDGGDTSEVMADYGQSIRQRIAAREPTIAGPDRKASGEDQES